MNKPRRTTTVSEAAWGVFAAGMVSYVMLGTILVIVHFIAPNGLPF